MLCAVWAGKDSTRSILRMRSCFDSICIAQPSSAKPCAVQVGVIKGYPPLPLKCLRAASRLRHRRIVSFLYSAIQAIDRSRDISYTVFTLAEDNVDASLRQKLSEPGHEIFVAGCGRAFSHAKEEAEIDLIVLCGDAMFGKYGVVGGEEGAKRRIWGLLGERDDAVEDVDICS